MIELYRPEFADLWFRRQMLEDPDTMSYNRAWGGTIPFPESKWADWYGHWVARSDGGRFYRYLKDARTGAFVGEIAYHYDSDMDKWLANVIVFAPFRGNGYGTQALALLCEAAKENGIAQLWDDIALGNPAAGMFLKAGFTEEYRTDEFVMLKKELA